MFFVREKVRDLRNGCDKDEKGEIILLNRPL